MRVLFLILRMARGARRIGAVNGLSRDSIKTTPTPPRDAPSKRSGTAPLRRRHATAALVACAYLTTPLGIGKALAAPRDSALSEGALLNLISLASERLSNARTVAEWKWAHKQQIDDPTQDANGLDDLLKLVPRFGIDPAFATTFFHDQFAASQQVQTALLAQWKKGSPADTPAPSALESARSDIYRTSQSLLSALARTQPIRSQADCPVILSHALVRWNTQMTSPDAIEQSALERALEHVCIGGIGGTA